MSRLALILAQASALALAVAAIWFGPAALPAFDAAARGVAPDGSWRAGSAREIYDRPAYYLALSTAHLNVAAGKGLAPTTELTGAIMRHSEQARRYALQSLETRPANPYAWAALARAERVIGEPADAAAALERSYAAAPHSVALAFPRVVVGYDLWAELSPAARRGLLRDFRYMHWRRDPAVREFLSTTPAAAAMNAVAAATETDGNL